MRAKGLGKQLDRTDYIIPQQCGLRKRGKMRGAIYCMASINNHVHRALLCDRKEKERKILINKNKNK